MAVKLHAPSGSWATVLLVTTAGLVAVLLLTGRAEGPTTAGRLATLIPRQATHGAGSSDWEAAPFYVAPAASEMRRIATSLQPVTDKISAHNYDALYAKVFEGPVPMRLRKLKVLEIGLGCNMRYGPGASAQLWSRYFPNSEIWFAEYNTECVDMHREKLTAMGIKGAVTGDQADIPTLERWIEETGGDFDVIIDDGGHKVHQQFNTFAVLFPRALKPGGAFFLEDLTASRLGGNTSKRPPYIMNDVLMNWLDSMLSTNYVGTWFKGGDLAWPKQPRELYGQLPPGIKSMDCAPGICQFVKCLDDDPACLRAVKSPRSQYRRLSR